MHYGSHGVGRAGKFLAPTDRKPCRRCGHPIYWKRTGANGICQSCRLVDPDWGTDAAIPRRPTTLKGRPRQWHSPDLAAVVGEPDGQGLWAVWAS